MSDSTVSDLSSKRPEPRRSWKTVGIALGLFATVAAVGLAYGSRTAIPAPPTSLIP
jgi:hypothetical protein